MNIFMFVLAALSLYLILRHPLLKIGFPLEFEVGVSILLFSIVVFYYTVTQVVPYIMAQEDDGVPCNSKTTEAQCYRLETEICRAAWLDFEKECITEVKKTINPERYTALIGPQVRRCVQKKFDDHMYYNRRTEPPGCAEYFASLVEK